MYIVDDICYAGNLDDGIKVVDVKAVCGGVLIVTFSTGEKRLFDTAVLTGSAFASLRDESICNNPALFHGVITWKDGEIDVAPETVYKESFAYQDKDVDLVRA